MDSEHNNYTTAKYEMLFSHLASLKMKDVRQLFCKMRTDTATPNALFPAYGFTAGEFTTGYVFNMPNRNKNTYSADTRPLPQNLDTALQESGAMNVDPFTHS